MSISPALIQNAVRGLQQARTELLSIPKAELTYAKLSDWRGRFRSAMEIAESLGAPLIFVNARQYAVGYKDVSDVEILDGVRARTIALLDRTLLA